MSDENGTNNIDIRTPYNVELRAFYKRSFAYYTVKERMPVIITQTIDTLVRNKDNIVQNYGCTAADELKNVIGELSKLKYEIQTNKLLEYINSEEPDAKLYNDYIDHENAIDGCCTYFNAKWLLTECYMYRKIREIFENTINLKSLDPFKFNKDEAFRKSINMQIEIGSYVLNVLKEKQCANNKDNFNNLLKMNLWGNKCDLSLSLGNVNNAVEEISSIKELDSKILCNHSDNIWAIVSDLDHKSQIIDIILDNSGYELFTDMCLADYMITKNYCKKIRFYVKTIPWFISDAMVLDIKWFLKELTNNESPILKELGDRWQNFFDDNLWTMEEHNFWTLPFDYSVMSVKDNDLYKKLGESKLAIFKGDLNYRKLFGDIHWDPETSIRNGLRGFHPTNVCTLRTLKADIICGLGSGVAQKTEKIETNWLSSGNFGVIQFCEHSK